MEYWIIVDNKHAGPYSAKQLLDAGLTADTLVWHEGLTDWARAGNVAELAEGIELMNQAAAEAAATDDAPAANPVQEAEPAAYNRQEEATQWQQQPSDAYDNNRQEVHNGYADANYQQQGYNNNYNYGNGENQQYQQPQEPCPPAYIAWSVIVTLLCCTIIGIPAIVFSSMTKSAYYRGDLAKAKRYSELAQWFIIASIVLGVLGIPFQMALMGML